MTDARAVIAAAALLLGVTACSGDDPEPIVAPTPSSSVPSDPSTSPVSPRVSPSQSARDEQSAFVRLYFDTISDSLSTGDAQPFLDMSAPSCVNCERLAANLREAYANGGYVEGALWTIQSTSYEKSAPLGEVWNATVATAREQWFDSSGDLLKTVKASEQHFGLALEPAGGGWRVRELRVSS